MKAIPNSLRPDPYRKKPRPVELGPVSFRTAIHRVTDPLEGVADGKDKKHAGVETAYRETPLNVPGIVIQASDREYIVTREGSVVRSPLITRISKRTVSLAEKKARAKSVERIEASIAKADRRRAERARKVRAGVGR